MKQVHLAADIDLDYEARPLKYHTVLLRRTLSGWSWEWTAVGRHTLPRARNAPFRFADKTVCGKTIRARTRVTKRPHYHEVTCFECTRYMVRFIL